MLMLSVGSLDTDDMFCLREGVLHMSLTESTYHRAGVTGHLSKLDREQKRYCMVFSYQI